METQNGRSLVEQPTPVHSTMFSEEAYRLAAIAAILRNNTGLSSNERVVDIAFDLVFAADQKLWYVEHEHE